VEKITEISGAKVREWMGVAGDVEWDRLSGLTFPGVFAMAAMMHMDRYGTSRDDLCRVAVKNHANGSYNPKAHLRRRIDLDRTRTAPMVSYPLNLFDCCVNSSGAAVLIVCRPDRADRYTSRPVWVLGMGSATDHPNIALRPDPAGFEATRVAARRAYGEAGIGPADVDVAEVHDCFTIAEIMAYEDLGFCRPGEGGRLIGEGRTLLSGDIPVNPSGGLKSKGHPIGATGAAQIYEIAHQLRGDVIGPERQVKDARVGLTHNMGGFGATATVNLFGV
jgi:acetyl-CoA C-acetyltransferase/acetyl-CoA acyltransferase